MNFMAVTLVFLVGADYALDFPDFRSAERTFHLLTQVAGRADAAKPLRRWCYRRYHTYHYSIQFLPSSIIAAL